MSFALFKALQSAEMIVQGTNNDLARASIAAAQATVILPCAV